MNIQNCKISDINFRSGLNYKVLAAEKFVDPKKQEKMFWNMYGVEANFRNNKSNTLANLFCLNIFEKLSEKINLDFATPPAIFSYFKKELIEDNNTAYFCIPDTQNVLKNEYPFVGRSVFFANIGNLTLIDEITENKFNNKKISSNHFLSPFIHEWLHSIHLDLLYRKFGYGGKCEQLNSTYHTNVNKRGENSKEVSMTGVEILKEFYNKSFSEKENEVIYDILGEYSTQPKNQYLEVFSEAFTKFICDSLSGYELKSNPMDKLKTMPKEFLNILKKASLLIQD